MSTDALPSTGGRRAALRRQRRRRRRQQVGAALGVAVLLLLAVTVYFVRRDTDPPTTGVDEAQRTQQTLLLQVTDGTTTTSNALLAHDPDAGAGAVLLVPPQVLATPPGSQPVPFGSVLQTAGGQGARNALADLIGVTVDAGWSLDRPTLGALVDGVGGVTADVDVQVLGGPDGRQVLLGPGTQRLAGAQAVALASYLGPGEQEQARLARLQEVLDGVVGALPADRTQALALLDTLGPGSALEGLDVTGLADLLLGLQADGAGDALQYDSLPVVVVDAGGPEAALRLDADASVAVVDRLLAASVPPGVRQGGNRVKVFNGVGTPMLGSAVRDRLVAADLVYVPGGNAARFGVETTEVQIGEPTPEALELGRRVAAALGVPETAIRTSDPTTVADVVVVVGADFVP